MAQCSISLRRALAHALGGAPGHCMHPQMVGVAIAARRVIAHQYVGPLRLDEIHQARDLVVEVTGGEASGLIARDPGVGVAPGLQPRGAEDLGGSLKLTGAYTGEIVAVVRGREAGRSVGGDREDDPVALSGGARHRPRGEECLVIGVGVEEDQRGHGPILPPRARPHIGEWSVVGAAPGGARPDN